MWLEKLRGLDASKKEHRKLLIDNFVNSILVFNDHMKITFNYKDGCKIIPFEEIQKAASSAMKKAVGSDMESYGGPITENRRDSDFKISAAFFTLLKRA